MENDETEGIEYKGKLHYQGLRGDKVKSYENPKLKALKKKLSKSTGTKYGRRLKASLDRQAAEKMK